MLKALKERLTVLRLTLPPPILLGVFGVLQSLWLILLWLPSGKVPLAIAKWGQALPGPFWAFGWLFLLWLGALEHALARKEKFDRTSFNFFKAYLNHLIQEGHQLFRDPDAADLYTKVNDWQHKVIEGLGIGLGHGESERFFQKMDTQYPLSKAYQGSKQGRSNDPLFLWLQGHLEELETIRSGLEGTKLLGEGGPEVLKKEEPQGQADPRQLRLPPK